MLILFASIEFINIMHLLLYYFLLHVNYFCEEDWLTYTQDVYYHWYCCCCFVSHSPQNYAEQKYLFDTYLANRGFQINLSNNPDTELIYPRIFLYDINFFSFTNLFPQRSMVSHCLYFPHSSVGKFSIGICLQCRRPGFNSLVGKILWRRKWQYSCLENPMDREPWRATVHGVAKSDMT